MITAGINVKLLVSSPEAFKPDRIADIFVWIQTHLGAKWLERVLVSMDKSLLQAHFLIDVDPSPTGASVSWERIILEQPFHTEEFLSQVTVLKTWKSWKEILQRAQKKFRCENEEKDAPPFSDPEVSSIGDSLLRNAKWYRHGSEDSKDEDRLYLLDSIPDAKICTQLSSGVECDRNLFCVSKSPPGFVINCYRGLPDEVHNGLIATYSLHKQEHSLFIGDGDGILSERSMIRCVPLKVYSALMSILLRIRKTQHRDAIRDALRSKDFNVMASLLRTIDLLKLDPPLTIEDAKYLSFQLGQTIALICGADLYTKSAVVNQLPSLAAFLRRDKEAFEKQEVRMELTKAKDRLLQLSEGVSVHKRGDLLLFYIPPEKVSSWNSFHLQSRGTVIDTERLRVVAMPVFHAISLKERSKLKDWKVLLDDLENKDTINDDNEPERNEEENNVFSYAIGFHDTNGAVHWTAQHRFQDIKFATPQAAKKKQTENSPSAAPVVPDLTTVVVKHRSKGAHHGASVESFEIVATRDMISHKLQLK